MTASTTARQLTAACIHVRPHGPHRHVVYVPPGTDAAHDPALYYATAHDDQTAQRHADTLLALLAPLVDLGLARARVAPPPAGTPHPGAFFGALADAPYTIEDDDGQIG